MRYVAIAPMAFAAMTVLASAEPLKLTDGQMDEVSAGADGWFSVGQTIFSAGGEGIILVDDDRIVVNGGKEGGKLVIDGDKVVIDGKNIFNDKGLPNNKILLDGKPVDKETRLVVRNGKIFVNGKRVGHKGKVFVDGKSLDKQIKVVVRNGKVFVNGKKLGKNARVSIKNRLGNKTTVVTNESGGYSSISVTSVSQGNGSFVSHSHIVQEVVRKNH